MHHPNKYLLLFECARAVKGTERSLLCDLQRGKMDFIPNALFDLLQHSREYTIEELSLYYGEENKEAIEEYFSFLLEKDYAFLTDKDQLARFPALPLDWHSPHTISNCIWEIAKEVDKQIIEQLSELGVFAIELRLKGKWGKDSVYKLLEQFDQSTIKEIIIVMDLSGIDESSLINAFYHQLRLKEFICFNAGKDAYIREQLPDGCGIRYLSLPAIENKHCGSFQPYVFTNNIEHFTEALQHNTCLNRKISIDECGNIKNCPSIQESYGNIKDTSLAEALNKPEFKKYWNITKDQVSKCKDCEFRYVCTDCRAYLENPEDIYSKPLKCGYDPYTCEWEEWSANPIKQKAIVYYGLTAFETNKDKLS